jgi:ATP-binding cassette, subfamily B (MDR/TAP), member 1
MQTGSLVSQLSQNPQKFDGLAGITLGAIIQALSTVISGSILGLVFIWRVGLVGIGTHYTLFILFEFPR